MSKIFEILKCPDCGGGISSNWECVNCRRQYQGVDFIHDFIPQKAVVPDLKIYSDTDYQRFYAVQGQIEGYLYHNRNPLINWVQSSGYRAMIKLFKNTAGLTLECGCGTGIFLDIHGKINRGKYVMLDADLPSLVKIKGRDALAGVIKGTNYQLPFADHVFDTVLSHAHLEHLIYLDRALEEISRVLKPSGTFIASVPNEGGLLWTKGRDMTSARYFSKLLKIDYLRSNRIDHCNTVHQIERALRRYFVVQERIFFPLGFPSFNFNFTTTYLLRPMH